MNILFLGDVVGASGRQALERHWGEIQKRLCPDFLFINGENAAGGFGITPKICRHFFEMGVDGITLGNHAWDQKEIIPYIETNSRLIRPLNFPEGTPGKGYHLFQKKEGPRVLVTQVMGRSFMDPLDDPFRALDRLLETYRLGKEVEIILVDIHGEASSEKSALAHYLDGRVTGVFGTHTHTPTADTRIFSQGTAFQSDLGMCGDYDSVIGSQKEVWIRKFLKKVPFERAKPSEGEGTLAGVFVVADPKTGRATDVSPFRVGPHLMTCWPDTRLS